MSASYPRQFQVADFESLNETEEAIIWETLKGSLKTRGMIEVQFRNIGSAAKLRRKIYEHFGGYEIKFQRLTSQTAHILVGPEKVRTTASPANTAGTLRLKHPEELKQHEEVPAGFADEDMLDHISRLCPVCERRLSLTAFNKRGAITQSYCRDCNKAYAKWRHQILCQHGLTRLTPEVTEGHRKRNELFRAWFKTYQGE